MKTRNRFMAFAFLPLITGCVAQGPYYNPYQNTVAGSALGAVGGGLVGYAIEPQANGVLLGSLIGGVLGGATGYYMDNQNNVEYHQRHAEYKNGSRYRRQQRHYVDNSDNPDPIYDSKRQYRNRQGSYYYE